jgi:hypothetical protein
MKEMHTIIAAFLGGVGVTVAVAFAVCCPKPRKLALNQLPENIRGMLRELQTNPRFGHYVVLPAMSTELEDEIASAIRLERVNVYRSAVTHASTAYTLWSFDIEVPPEAITELCDSIIGQIQRQKAQHAPAADAAPPGAPTSPPSTQRS